MTVGIPRYLGYFSFWPLWETYFEELGMDVRTSPPSNQDTLDAGVRETVNDACIPIKLFHGHVMSLYDKVDILFIPRLVGTTTRYTLCPKFLGLPDMVKHSMNGLPRIAAPRLEVGARGIRLWRQLIHLGTRMTGARWTASRALVRARRALAQRAREIREDGLAALGFEQPSTADMTIGVVGYPYVLYDALSSGGILKQLRALGARVFTPETVDDEDMKRESRAFPENVFWYYSNRAIWSGLHFMKENRVDGLLHVSAFGCGPDAMVGKLLELEARERGVPFMSVTVDEHTGELGLQTRAEAFVDILRWQTKGDAV